MYRSSSVFLDSLQISLAFFQIRLLVFLRDLQWIIDRINKEEVPSHKYCINKTSKDNLDGNANQEDEYGGIVSTPKIKQAKTNWMTTKMAMPHTNINMGGISVSIFLEGPLRCRLWRLLRIFGGVGGVTSLSILRNSKLVTELT